MHFDDDDFEDESLELLIHRRRPEPSFTHSYAGSSSESASSETLGVDMVLDVGDDPNHLDAPQELWPRSRRGSALDSPFAILSMLSPNTSAKKSKQSKEPSYYLYDEPDDLANELLIKPRNSNQRIDSRTMDQSNINSMADEVGDLLHNLNTELMHFRTCSLCTAHPTTRRISYPRRAIGSIDYGLF